MFIRVARSSSQKQCFICRRVLLRQHVIKIRVPLAAVNVGHLCLITLRALIHRWSLPRVGVAYHRHIPHTSTHHRSRFPSHACPVLTTLPATYIQALLTAEQSCGVLHGAASVVGYRQVCATATHRYPPRGSLRPLLHTHIYT